MKKIGFVTPWYGENIPGGMEAELRGLVKNLHRSGMRLEILTTCVEKFLSDWNCNFYPAGYTIENEIPIRRFPVRQRDSAAFHAVNYKLMRNLPVTEEDEVVYTREMINSPDLYTWLKEKADDYSLFVFIPYMFGTTYYGLAINPEKSVLIPCLHDESYIYMQIFKRLFPQIKAMIFYAEPEMRLAECVYNLGSVNTVVLGAGVDTSIQGDKTAFYNKYRITKPFVLYAGRKDAGKNINLLLKYFTQYKKWNQNYLQLILIGGGNIDIPQDIKNDVTDLGFIDIQDKYNAYSSAALLCQPSVHESFSLVVMESWLCGRPVLVHSDCTVTKDFVQKSNGGLYFKTYYEFEACINYILSHNDTASAMGRQGKNFVAQNFAWNVIVDRYTRFFKELCGETA
ncbi:MAG: glycosyltransferase family 4 protein [Bacteroidales bacterium]|jgi:glycosyltransferase involved in cell wall biosynthesis|nr:glycosyltransferase family 4 protein [Bacteroidales bacterium]